MSDLIPDGWRIENIETIANVGSSKRILQSEYVPSGVPFFRSKEAIRRSKNLPIENPLYISKKRFKDLKDKHGAPKKNEILVTAVGTIGVIYLIEDIEFYFKDGNLLWIKHIDEDVSPSYLAKYLASDTCHNAIIEIAGGSSQSALTIEKLSKLEFNLPPLPEQQKIAAILSSVDEVIEKTQAQINKLKDLKTGMMQELLSPREGQAANINITQGESKNSLHHTEFKDSPLGRIPVGWEVKYFSEVIINLNQGVNTTTEKVTYSKSGVPAIRSNNVKENRLDMSNKKFVSLDIFNQLSNKVKPNANDILYCNIGSDLGAASVVTTNENFLITWNILRITANIDIVLPKFFSYLLNSNRKELRKVATESTMPFISSKVLSKFQFIIPPVDAQIPLVKILESVDKKIYVAESKLKSLKNSKKALMQDLLTGKVRVTAPSHPCDHGISASMHVTVDAS